MRKDRASAEDRKVPYKLFKDLLRPRGFIPRSKPIRRQDAGGKYLVYGWSRPSDGKPATIPVRDGRVWGSIYELLRQELEDCDPGA